MNITRVNKFHGQDGERKLNCEEFVSSVGSHKLGRRSVEVQKVFMDNLLLLLDYKMLKNSKLIFAINQIIFFYSPLLSSDEFVSAAPKLDVAFLQFQRTCNIVMVAASCLDI